jgi:hypothetical protein
MTTTWTIEVDWERTGNFNGTYDDVTSRVMNANWFLGMRKPYQDMGDDSMLELVLNNSDKRFSPENTSSPLSGDLAPFRPVRVQSNDGTTTRSHYTGWIEKIEPSVNQYGERQVKITCAGPMQFFKGVQTNIAIQENKRSDQIIDTLLDEVQLPPALVGKAIIGLSGSNIGSVSIVGDDEILIDRTLDTGKTTLAYAADNWVRGGENAKKKSFDVYRAIKDVVAAERGRFFFDRSGQAVFWNRHNLIVDQTLQATFDNSMMDMGYTFAGLGEFANDITVNCHPRAISADSNELLWQLEEALTLEPREEREIGAAYKDASDNRIGARNITLANASFQSGNKLVEGKVRLVEAGANRAKILVRNPSATKKAVLETCEVRGQKITDFGQMEALARDGISIVKYGQRDMQLDLRSVDNLNNAQYIADFELMRRKEPSGKVQSIILKSHGKNGGGVHANQLALTIGDRIRVKEAQSEHDGEYFIIGEAHKLSQSATLLETTWYVESATEGNWFVIGTSDIGSDAELLPY